MRPRQALRWGAPIGLLTCVIALSFVLVDRSNLPIMFVLVVVGSTLWFICWRYREYRLKTVLLFAILSRVVLIGIPPSLSDDAYRYIWDGLVQQEDLNPYQYAPEDVPVDGLFDTNLRIKR